MEAGVNNFLDSTPRAQVQKNYPDCDGVRVVLRRMLVPAAAASSAPAGGTPCQERTDDRSREYGAAVRQNPAAGLFGRSSFFTGVPGVGAARHGCTVPQAGIAAVAWQSVWRVACGGIHDPDCTISGGPDDGAARQVFCGASPGPSGPPVTPDTARYGHPGAAPTGPMS